MEIRENDGSAFVSITNYFLNVAVSSNQITPSKSLRTGPNLKSVTCHALSVCAVNGSCTELACSNNDNIVTAISSSLNLAILCGNAKNCHMRDLSDISLPFDDTITEQYRCDFSSKMTVGHQTVNANLRTLSSEFSVDDRNFLVITIGTSSRVYLMSYQQGDPEAKKSAYELVGADDYSENKVDRFLAHHSHDGYTFSIKVMTDGSTEVGRFCEAAVNSYYSQIDEDEYKNRLKTSYNYLKIRCIGEKNLVLSEASHVDFINEHIVAYFNSNTTTVYVCKISISTINDHFYKLRKACSENRIEDVVIPRSGSCSNRLKKYVSL